MNKATRIKTAAAALKAFGPEGDRPLTGVRLVKNGSTSWSVQHRGVDLNWENMAHFTCAAEVVEWANRF